MVPFALYIAGSCVIAFFVGLSTGRWRALLLVLACWFVLTIWADAAGQLDDNDMTKSDMLLLAAGIYLAPWMLAAGIGVSVRRGLHHRRHMV